MPEGYYKQGRPKPPPKRHPSPRPKRHAAPMPPKTYLASTRTPAPHSPDVGMPLNAPKVLEHRAHGLYKQGRITRHQRNKLIRDAHHTTNPLNLLAGIPLGLYAGLRAGAHDTKTFFTDPHLTDLIPGYGIARHYQRGQTGHLAKEAAVSVGESFLHPGRDPMMTAFNAVTLFGTGLAGLSKVGARVAPTSRVARMGRPVPLRVRSPAARAGQEGGSVAIKKMTSHMPLRKGIQLLSHKLMEHVPEKTPHFNEADRWARAARHPRQPHEQRFMSLKLQHGREYDRNVRKLNEDERLAVKFFPHDVSPKEYLEFLRHQKHPEPEVIRLLSDPVVGARLEHLYHRPTPRMKKILEADKKFSAIGTQMMLEKHWMTPESAEVAPYRLARQVAGGRYERPKLSELPQEQWGKLVGKRVRPVDRNNVGRIVSVDVEKGTAKVHFHNKKENARATVEFPLEHLYDPKAKKVLVGGESAFTERSPYYAPIKPPPERIPNLGAGMMGAGKGVPAIPVRASEGVIAEIGRFVHGEDINGPEFLRKLLAVYKDDLHNVLEEGSMKIDRKEALRGAGLPKGYEYVRRRVGKTPEKIPAGAKTRAAFKQSIDRSLEELIPNVEKPLEGPLGEGFGTTDINDAAVSPDGKHFLIMPTRTMKNFTGEFSRAQNSVGKLISTPTNLWRSIILGYRPGFFTNNLVGNALMYAMHIGPVRGLTPIADRARGKTLSHEFHEQVFPEQQQGTFGGTQAPLFETQLGVAMGRKVRRAAKFTGQGIIPFTQRVAETGFRRGIIHTVLAKHPEVRKLYREMPKQTRDFEQAARQAIEHNPEIARHVSQRVNDALGDYLALGQIERRVVRQFLPFYAWYRTIAVITAKTPFETPGRALIVAQLSKIGDEAQQDKFGFRLPYGALAIGAQHGDIQKVITTGGMNPYATIPQLLEPGQEVFALNPFLASVAQEIGQPPWEATGALKGVPWLRYPLDAAANTVRNLPFSQFDKGPSELYPHRGPQQQLLGFAGVPLKDMSLSVAKSRAPGEGGKKTKKWGSTNKGTKKWGSTTTTTKKWGS